MENLKIETKLFSLKIRKKMTRLLIQPPQQLIFPSYTSDLLLIAH